MKKQIIFTLLILVCIACKESDSNSFLNKNNYSEIINNEFLEEQILNSKYDTILRNKLLSYSDKFYYKNDFKRFYDINKIVLEKSVLNNDSLGLITSNYNIGIYYLNIFKTDSSYYFFTKAEKVINKFHNKKLLDLILLNKSSVLWAQKNYTEAESLAVKALNISIKKNDFEQVFLCYIAIANSQIGLNDQNQALHYYEKALEVTKKLSLNTQKTHKTLTINYIAALYQKQNKHQKTISILEKEINEKELRKLDIKLYCYQKNTKNYSKFKLGDKSSLNQFLETLKIGDSLQFPPIQITSKTYLGEYYLAQKDTLKANRYLKEAQVQSHKNNIFEDELKILQLLAQANLDEESFYSNRYITLNDSLQALERAARDKFARIEFETDEIKKERNSLTVEKEDLSFQRLIILGISILSLVIIVLWFMNKSQKAKTRELLLKQEQQKANEDLYQLMIDQQQKIEEGKNIEKQRISLDLHDSVMGKLTAVRLNLYVALLKNNLADDVDLSKQIDEIQEVEKEIRAIAHDLNSNLFSDNASFIGIVQQLFNRIENHSQLQFNLHVCDALHWDLVSNTIKINLYRVLQEALQNIEKYANATQVTIVMTLSDANQIAIEISDDGNGFDTSKKSLGIGLKNIQFRIEEIKGTFTIQSEIGKGTKINLTIPL